MELEVKEIQKTSYEGSDKEETFTTTLKQVSGDIVVKAKEELECTFVVGDMWELKKIESQTKVNDHAIKK